MGGEIDQINERIVKAARALILEEGPKITITDVAKAAKISRPTVYTRYENIEKLVAEVLTRDVSSILDSGAMPTTRTELVQFIVGTTARVRDSQLLQKIIATDPTLLLEYQFSRLGRTQREIIEFLVYLLQHCSHTRQDNPYQIAMFVLVLVQGTALSAKTTAEFLPEGAWESELTLMLERFLQP
ncbi:MAG: TetR/AcrR family transcriptional regulator [Actinomycetaceae bacterium]|nr:TetR/AcrR family transcriptional regulator [Actinomycetaceae bacterium]